MGKALVIQTADFSNIAVDLSDVILDKDYTEAMLRVGAVNGFSDSGTGRIRTDVSGFTHKIVSVEGYTQVIINGGYPIHIGAFYSSKTSIGTGTFVSCNGKLTRSNQSAAIATLYVPIPETAVAISLNLASQYTNHRLQVKK